MARTIVVAGKGGTGKTTVAALIIKYLREHECGSILALDADPDANLATVLGIPIEKTIGDLREETLGQIKNLPPGMSKMNYIEAGLHQIVVETDKVDLITMGRGEGPSCYCYVNNLLRKFAEYLMNSYDWLVMDTEAGLEHLSRSTAARIDDLIVVVSESPLGMDCARRISEMIPSLKNPVGRSFFVMNSVRDEHAAAVREAGERLGLKYLGAVPRDVAIEDLVFNRESIYKLNGSPAARSIDDIMQALLTLQTAPQR